MGQISRRTKTGNYLTLIQGEGLGTGRAIGQLRLVTQNEAAERLVAYSYQNETKLETKEWSQKETLLGRVRRLVGLLVG
jgi:hypothetical protein